MTIEECKKAKILPAEGTPVRTILRLGTNTSGFLVKEKYIKARRESEGEFYGCAAGAGGDVWWIKHENEIAAYLFTEVFDR